MSSGGCPKSDILTSITKNFYCFYSHWSQLWYSETLHNFQTANYAHETTRRNDWQSQFEMRVVNPSLWIERRRGL